MRLDENPGLFSELDSEKKEQIIQQEKEQAISDSEHKYYQLFNSIDQGYCVINLVFDDDNKPVDYRFLEVNAAFEQQTSLTNATGKCISEIAPTQEQYWFDIYGKVALTGEPLRFQRWAEEFNRYYDTYAFRIGKPDEKKVAVLFNDVTEKKRAEANLAFLCDITQSLICTDSLEETIQIIGAKMGAFFRLSYFVFLRIDETGNEAVALYNWHPLHLPNITGFYHLHDYLGKEFQSLSRQGKTFVVCDVATGTHAQGEKYKDLGIGSFISIPLKRNGEWQFSIALCRNEAYNWRDDEISLVQEAAAIIWSSLERKRAERDLIFSEERLRLAVEAGRVGICDLNYQTGETFCNVARYEMYGMKPSIDAMPVNEFLSRTHPDDVEKLNRNARKAIETEGRYKEEFRVLHPDGTIYWVSETGQVTEWENGKPRRVISTLLDITERKTEEQQKDDFFNVASHELKTPVTSIKAFTYLLEDMFRQANDSFSEGLTNQLNRQVDRLTKLISNMLDAARAAGGRLDYQIESVDILAVLKQTIQDIQGTTKNHAISLSSSPLPSVSCDGERLAQVFTHLLSNAIKFTPVLSTLEQKNITVKTFLAANEIKISFTDMGIGMSAGTTTRLFQRFFRSDTPETHHYPGLGLGLYISKEIMQKHGGAITVESEKGKGSTFTVVLPILAK